MAEHIVGGRTYLVGKINARQQYDVMRRLGFMSMVLENPVSDDHVEGARFIAGMASGWLANVPQADSDFVLSTCLAAVTTIREAGGRPTPVMNRATGLMQFDDIDMPAMLELVDLVIQENLSPFFESLRRNREAAGSGETG